MSVLFWGVDGGGGGVGINGQTSFVMFDLWSILTPRL